MRSTVAVYEPLLGLTNAELELRFDGPTSSILLVDNVSFPGIVNGDFETGSLSGWTTHSTGSGTTEVIAVDPQPLTPGESNFGDYNRDRRVDAADYVVWRKTDETSAEYYLWRERFGEMVTGLSSSVPEPCAFSLAGIAMLFFCASRRLKRP